MDNQQDIVDFLDEEYIRINYHEAGFSYLLPEILTLFIEQSFLHLQKLELLFQHGNLHELSIEAHTLKGSASSIGATTLADTAQTIEINAESANMEDLALMFDKLKRTIESTNIAIAKKLEKLSESENTDLDLF